MSARPKGPYPMQPPVLSVRVEKPMDIMITRNTARRAAGLLGFTPVKQAQLASAAGTLAELTLKTGDAHVLHLNGVSFEHKKGVQLSAVTPWLAGVSTGNVMTALRSKVGDLVDEILVEAEDGPTIIMIMWRSDEGEDDEPPA